MAGQRLRRATGQREGHGRAAPQIGHRATAETGTAAPLSREARPIMAGQRGRSKGADCGTDSAAPFAGRCRVQIGKRHAPLRVADCPDSRVIRSIALHVCKVGISNVGVFQPPRRVQIGKESFRNACHFNSPFTKTVSCPQKYLQSCSGSKSPCAIYSATAIST